jgi:hypothetical protein
MGGGTRRLMVHGEAELRAELKRARRPWWRKLIGT